MIIDNNSSHFVWYQFLFYSLIIPTKKKNSFFTRSIWKISVCLHFCLLLTQWKNEKPFCKIARQNLADILPKKHTHNTHSHTNHPANFFSKQQQQQPINQIWIRWYSTKPIIALSSIIILFVYLIIAQNTKTQTYLKIQQKSIWFQTTQNIHNKLLQMTQTNNKKLSHTTKIMYIIDKKS